MPRRNKRKEYTTGKTAVFFNGAASGTVLKPRCVGCAFAGDGGVCMTSDGKCLITTPEQSERREADIADRQR